MDGITILNQTEIMQSSIPGGLLLILILGGAGSFAIMLAGNSIGNVISGIVCAFVVICLVAIGIAGPEEPTGRYEYECIIDDSVSLTDVYEKYEVVEQRGEIWVLRDKED